LRGRVREEKRKGSSGWNDEEGERVEIDLIFRQTSYIDVAD
jgi:hypothetical protein